MLAYADNFAREVNRSVLANARLEAPAPKPAVQIAEPDYVGQLQSLRDAGILTEAEFIELRQRAQAR